MLAIVFIRGFKENDFGVFQGDLCALRMSRSLAVSLFGLTSVVLFSTTQQWDQLI